TGWQVRERPSPTPDGEERNFVVRFPLANVKPRIFVYPADVVLNDQNQHLYEVDPDYIGTQEENDRLYMKWIYTPESNVITHNSGEIEIGPDERIAITYKGLRNLMVVHQNTSGISERRVKELGTSGKYERIDVEPKVNTAEGAMQSARAMIEKYGKIQNVVEFETWRHGLRAGQ